MLDEDIEAHKIFNQAIRAFISECLVMGVSPEQILASFEKYINEEMDRMNKEKNNG